MSPIDNLATKKALTIFWFRRDLRLYDNRGLFEALNSSDAVLPLFIFDTTILEKLPTKEDKRIAFIHQAISEIHNKLVNLGSSLLVMKGDPIEIFKELITKFSIHSVYANSDYEPLAIMRDEKINNLLQNNNIQFKLLKDQVIFEKFEIVKEDGTPYKIFTPYSKAWKSKLQTQQNETFASENITHRFIKIKPIPIPLLNEIGFNNCLTQSVKPIINEDIITDYHKTRNYPFINGTSNLSVHLRFGTVSVRHIVNIASKLNEQFLNELIWREFFMMILFHHPYVAERSFKKKYDFIQWRNNEVEFEKWCLGETGYPMVDAGMRELNATGIMHNRVRMIVASFLTKHLLIDWRWGEAYFAEKLLDFELSSNNGNWQWASGCGSDSAPYFRIFNPTDQQKKFDPDFIYIKKWVSNLNVPDYPKPIVDHKFARERCLKVFKASLKP